MTRSTDQWRELLDGTTPGPWGCRWDEGHLAIVGPDEEAIAFDADERDSNLIVAAPEAVAEVVRLRRELEERREYLIDALSNESIESYDDLDGAWVSVQKYGELSEMIDQRDFLTRILEGGNDG